MDFFERPLKSAGFFSGNRSLSMFYVSTPAVFFKEFESALRKKTFRRRHDMDIFRFSLGEKKCLCAPRIILNRIVGWDQSET